MHWTYDPLESRNAWLNLGRLGAVAREYVVDMYGPGESPLHEGIGTDRLVVTWELESDRTEARLAGRGSAPPAWEGVQQLPRAFEVDTSGPRPRPVPSDAGVMDGGAALLVPIPADVQALKAVDPAGAVDWREATRAALAPRLAEGWEIRELVRSPGPVSHYLVVRPGEEPGEPATDAP
jgi:predicted GNAT superfamily acetyltransferase